MKNLSFTLILFLIALSCFGQDFEANTTNANISAIAGSPGGVELNSYIDVTNTGTSTLTLKVKREIISEVEDSKNKFCWGIYCYGFDDSVSFFTEDISVGETLYGNPPDSASGTGFIGYYFFNQNVGATKIRYTFFKADDESVSTSVVIGYCVDTQENCETALGTNELVSEPELQTSPNPANASALLSYDLGNTPSSAYISIRDVLGKEVQVLNISHRFGIVNLDTSEFQDGMYFYTLVNKNEVLGTKRLLVSH